MTIECSTINGRSILSFPRLREHDSREGAQSLTSRRMGRSLVACYPLVMTQLLHPSTCSSSGYLHQAFRKTGSINVASKKKVSRFMRPTLHQGSIFTQLLLEGRGRVVFLSCPAAVLSCSLFQENNPPLMLRKATLIIHSVGCTLSLFRVHKPKQGRGLVRKGRGAVAGREIRENNGQNVTKVCYTHV